MTASLAGQMGKTIGFVIVVMVLLLLVVWLFQRRLIYFPLDPHVPPAGSILPGASDVSITTSDGLELGAWFLPAPDAAPRATVLVSATPATASPGRRWHERSPDVDFR